MVGDHKNRSVIFAKPNSSLSLDPRSAASLRSVDGLRDHLVEVAEVVRAPEVRHAPVVVVPEVRGAARAQGAHEVIPLLGPEISEMNTKYNHIYFYKIFKILIGKIFEQKSDLSSSLDTRGLVSLLLRASSVFLLRL